jgi:hypothetical protein
MTTPLPWYDRAVHWLALRDGKPFHRSEFPLALGDAPSSVGFGLSYLKHGGVVVQTSGQRGYWQPADLTVSKDECNRLYEANKKTLPPRKG